MEEMISIYGGGSGSAGVIEQAPEEFHPPLSYEAMRWNQLVGSMIFEKETETHYHFVHPTKGKRKISKKRFGI